MNRTPLIAALAALLLVFAGCAQPSAPQQNNTTTAPQYNPAEPPANTTNPPENNSSGIPNPASEFCARNNGTLEIHAGPEGEYGACAFPDGAKCEEWAFFRGECSPERPDFCRADSDCSCGVHVTMRDCFYGQKEFVDPMQQCPDYCSGIAAHLEIVCVNHQCSQRMRDGCLDYGVDECPAGCSVCPPCPECSSIRCQSEEACEESGFGKGWYNQTPPPR